MVGKVQLPATCMSTGVGVPLQCSQRHDLQQQLHLAMALSSSWDPNPLTKFFFWRLAVLAAVTMTAPLNPPPTPTQIVKRKWIGNGSTSSP